MSQQIRYYSIIHIIKFILFDKKILLNYWSINIEITRRDKKWIKIENYWRKPRRGYLRRRAKPVGINYAWTSIFLGGVPRIPKSYEAEEGGSSGSIVLHSRVAPPPCFRYPVPPPIFMRAGESGWFHGIWKVSGPRTGRSKGGWILEVKGRGQLWRGKKRRYVVTSAWTSRESRRVICQRVTLFPEAATLAGDEWRAPEVGALIVLRRNVHDRWLDRKWNDWIDLRKKRKRLANNTISQSKKLHLLRIFLMRYLDIFDDDVKYWNNPLCRSIYLF